MITAGRFIARAGWFTLLVAWLAASSAWAQRPPGQQRAPQGPPPRTAPPANSSPGQMYLPPPAAPATPPPAENSLKLQVPSALPESVQQFFKPQATDPTVPGPEIRNLLESGNANANRTPTAQPNFTIPAIRIKARVISRDKPAAALLDVGSTTLRVHLGSDIIVPAGEGVIQLKVVELSSTVIRLENESRRQTLVLN